MKGLWMIFCFDFGGLPGDAGSLPGCSTLGTGGTPGFAAGQPLGTAEGAFFCA